MRIAMLVASFWLVTSPLWGQIVFYSKRHENWEIYTMDADDDSRSIMQMIGLPLGLLTVSSLSSTAVGTAATKCM